MKVLVSKINISIENAIVIAKASIEKKGLAFWETTRKVVQTYNDEIREVYFPYFIFDVTYRKSGLFSKTMNYRQIMAMDGVTGEVGVVIGMPIADEEELESKNIINARFAMEEAQLRIEDYMKKYFVRTKRFIPQIENSNMFIIYKPAYIIPLDFEDKEGIKKCCKVVDAESGCLVYRYDFEQI